MANYCTECGSMIPQDSKFCPGCGKQQSASDARQAAQPQPTSEICPAEARPVIDRQPSAPKSSPSRTTAETQPRTPDCANAPTAYDPSMPSPTYRTDAPAPRRTGKAPVIILSVVCAALLIGGGVCAALFFMNKGDSVPDTHETSVTTTAAPPTEQRSDESESAPMLGTSSAAPKERDPYYYGSIEKNYKGSGSDYYINEWANIKLNLADTYDTIVDDGTDDGAFAFLAKDSNGSSFGIQCVLPTDEDYAQYGNIDIDGIISLYADEISKLFYDNQYDIYPSGNYNIFIASELYKCTRISYAENIDFSLEGGSYYVCGRQMDDGRIIIITQMDYDRQNHGADITDMLSAIEPLN